jgi:hypothetical protein
LLLLHTSDSLQLTILKKENEIFSLQTSSTVKFPANQLLVAEIAATEKQLFIAFGNQLAVNFKSLSPVTQVTEIAQQLAAALNSAKRSAAAAKGKDSESKGSKS